MRTRTAQLVVTGLVCSGLVLAGPVSTGGATTGPLPIGGGWSPPETVSTQPSVRGLADVAVGPDAEMAAAWAADGVTWVSRRTPDGTWTRPVRLSSASYPLASYPRLAYDGSGRLTAAWIYGTQGGEMYVEYRRTRPNGRWGGTRIVGQWDYGHYSALDLAANADGDLVLGWLTAAGVYLADKAGTHYMVSKRVKDVVAFDVAIADNGLRVAALRTDDGAGQTLSVIRKPGGGSWSEPSVLWAGSEPGYRAPPGLAVDATGTATVVWRQPAGGGWWDLVASRAAQGEDWSTPEVVNARVGLGPTVVRGAPAGDVLVVFRRYGSVVKAVRYAGGWGEPALLGAADPSVKDLDAALDPSGRAAAVWSPTAVPGALGDGVLAAVMTPGGDWRRVATLLRPGRLIARGSLHAGAGHGDLLAAWSRRRSDGTFVVTARVRSPG